MVEIKNYMEVCVKEILPKVLKEMNCCTCETCKMDISAIVLNKLPPKYIVTSKGQIYAKMSFLQRQFEVDIVSEITKAVKLVSENPRH